MKREYQKYVRKASKGNKPNGAEGNEDLRIPFDRSEVQRILSEALDNFATEMGRLMAIGLLEDEVKQLCGEWHVPDTKREMVRHGAQRGWVTIGGQKAAIKRPRVRYTKAGGAGEAHLPLYAQMQDRRTLTEAVLRRMVRGVSCRNYEGVVDCARGSFGVKRSSVSRAFRESMVERIRSLSERRWDGVRFAVIFIDGKDYAGEMMIAAVGIKTDGIKVVLGLRQGATENAEVVKDLLENLHKRGVATDKMTLFVLDGAKALSAGVRRVWGRYAFIHRCQVHKRRNVEQHLGEAYWPELRRRMGLAYKGDDYDQSLKVLKDTAKWLDGINPDAAASLREGMEETLTVIRLGIPALLRRSLASTNIIDSSFSTAQMISDRVKLWQEDGAMKWRWCAAGLSWAEEHYRRVPGYRFIPRLIAAMEEIGKTEGLDYRTEVG
jgi:transposase-like protein